MSPANLEVLEPVIRDHGIFKNEHDFSVVRNGSRSLFVAFLVFFEWFHSGFQWLVVARSFFLNVMSLFDGTMGSQVDFKAVLTQRTF